MWLALRALESARQLSRSWKWSSAALPPTLRTFRELARFMLQPGQWTCKDKRSAHWSARSRKHSKAARKGLLPPGVSGTGPDGLGPSPHWHWDVPTPFLAWTSRVQLYLTPSREKHSCCVSFSVKMVFLKHHMQTPSATVFSLFKTWLVGAKRFCQRNPLT